MAQATVPSPPPCQRAFCPLPPAAVPALRARAKSLCSRGLQEVAGGWRGLQRPPGSGVEGCSVQTGPVGPGAWVEGREGQAKVPRRPPGKWFKFPAEAKRAPVNSCPPRVRGRRCSAQVLLSSRSGAAAAAALTSGCSALRRRPWRCPSASPLQPVRLSAERVCRGRVRSPGPWPLTVQERGSPSAQRDLGQVAGGSHEVLSAHLPGHSESESPSRWANWPRLEPEFWNSSGFTLKQTLLGRGTFPGPPG